MTALSVLFFSASDRAEANILVQIDRSSQTMTVVVDGAPRYDWRVSTGRPGLGTPGGVFHPQMLAARWFSRKYDNSPMPHSIFFTRRHRHSRHLRDRGARPAGLAWLRAA